MQTLPIFSSLIKLGFRHLNSAKALRSFVKEEGGYLLFSSPLVKEIPLLSERTKVDQEFLSIFRSSLVH